MTRRSRRLLLAAVLVPLSVAAPLGTAGAQAPQEIALARETAKDGLLAYKEGEYDKALMLFQQARALYPSAQILRMTGYTLLALSKWESAAQAMEESLASSIGPLSDADRKDVQAQLEKAMAHLGVLDVTTRLPDAKLVVDGADPLPMPLAKPVRVLAGKHTLTVVSPEHPEITREIEVEGGETIQLSLDPKETARTPPTPPPPKPRPPAPPPAPRQPWFPQQRTVGYALAGSGLGLGIAAIVTAVAGARIRSQVEDDVALHKENYGEACNKNDPRDCRFDRAVINQDADRADSFRDASVWLAVGGGVLAAGGAVLLVAWPWGSPRQEVAGGNRLGCSLASPVSLSCAGSF